MRVFLTVLDSFGIGELQDAEKFGDKVEIVGSPCLGVCSTNWEISKAPYIKVNNVLIQEATIEEVLAEIEAQIKKGE